MGLFGNNEQKVLNKNAHAKILVDNIVEEMKNAQVNILKVGFEDILEDIMGDGKKLVSVSRKLKKAQADLEKLEEHVKVVKGQLANEKSVKELEVAQMEHLMAMEKERIALEAEKKQVEREKEWQTKELEQMKTLYKKMEDFMENKSEDLNKLYEQVLSRLPNVNYKIKEDRSLNGTDLKKLNKGDE